MVKKPVGHHRHRYGAIVMGIALILAAVLAKLGLPMYQTFIVLGVITLIAAATAHGLEEEAPRGKKKPVGHHRHRYGPYVAGIGLLLVGLLYPTGPINPKYISLGFEDLVAIIGALVLIGGIIAYLREG